MHPAKCRTMDKIESTIDISFCDPGLGFMFFRSKQYVFYDHIRLSNKDLHVSGKTLEG